jgi:hypothetical protein
MLEGFFHLPPVSLTPVANLELRITPRIFKKIRNDPNGIIRGLGETDSRKKTRSKKSRDTVPLRSSSDLPVGQLSNLSLEALHLLPDGVHPALNIGI